MALQPNASHGLLILDEVSRSHTTTHNSWWDSSWRVISPSQKSLSDNTQHSQQTSTSPVGFEPTISAGEWPQTYALDRAATGTDWFIILGNSLLCGMFVFYELVLDLCIRFYWKNEDIRVWNHFIRRKPYFQYFHCSQRPSVWFCWLKIT